MDTYAFHYYPVVAFHFFLILILILIQNLQSFRMQRSYILLFFV